MEFSPTRTATIGLLLLALSLPAANAQASAAGGTKLVVTSPDSAPRVAGPTAARATLKVKRRAWVRRARFYVNGKIVTTDRTYPFKIKRHVKYDTRKLRRAKPYLTIAVKSELRRKNGRTVTRTLKKRVRVSLPAVPGKPGEFPGFGYPLALNEEFNGASLNTALWNTGRYDIRDHIDADDPAPFTRPYNGSEGAAYGADNVSLRDGALSLEPLDSPAPRAPESLTRSTGMVNTMNKFAFKYGYVETRVMVPDCAEVYIDGKLGATVRGASKLPHQPMYLIYQMSIGLPTVGIPAAHSTMKIDYLRVYTNSN
jgi:hypothetical protein